MKRIIAAMLLAGITPSVACGAEKPLASHITSLGLFKNGLALVERSIEVAGPGSYRLENLPVPVHGTFWIESDGKVAVRMTQRMVEVPATDAPQVDFQEGLAGREVVVHFTDGQIPPASGTVLDILPAVGESAWDRGYQEPQFGYGRRIGPRSASNSPAEPMLVLRSGQSRSYVRRSMIAHLQVKDAGETVHVRRPVMLLNIQGETKKPVKAVVRYLTKGIAWAPSYHIDIACPKRLVLRQNAIIKNELEPIQDADIRLISGFPSIRFANVTSPLSLTTTWGQFFQQLNQRYSEGHASMSNVVMQQAVAFNPMQPEGGLDLSATPDGEGVDLHYQPIGRQTLDEGDSLALETAAGEAEYDRIVEWIVPDARDAQGRYIPEHQRQSDPEKFQDAVWDAIRFRNPLKFPMTTAPATVASGDRFSGQQMSYWVNVGEQTTLHVTKALSVRTRSAEHEVEGARDVVYIGGDDYRKSAVEGALRASNHRNEPITLVIRRRFSGELVSAEGDPKKTLLEEGVWSVNRRNQLTWTRQVQPGEEVSYTYRYTVLVRQ